MTSPAPSDPRDRTIGVFASGVGGLTVLHELLGTRFLQMPLGEIEQVELQSVGVLA